MLDLKLMKSALDQLEEERKIPRQKILDALEQALAAAYKKDYGKKGQIVRCKLDVDSGKMDFYQVKIAVDESTVKMEEEIPPPQPSNPTSALPEGKGIKREELKSPPLGEVGGGSDSENADERQHFNPEHHILLEDAKKIKKGVKLEDELTFPLEIKEDFGRIAAQTAKQVIIQRIREAEREGVMQEFGGQENEIVSGIVQKIEHGNAFVDFGQVVGLLPYEEQIPNESLRRGQRIKCFLYSVEETPRGVNLRLSRSHPRFLEKLFALEAPEVSAGTVEVRAIAREPGSRSKIAVWSNDPNVDPVGSCVGQKGIRVSTVMGELSNEKIDIIPWAEDPAEFVTGALSPAKVLDIELDEGSHTAKIEVADEQLSLAIGKGGQNVRLAAKLTGWRIDIRGTTADAKVLSSEEVLEVAEATEKEKTEEKK